MTQHAKATTALYDRFPPDWSDGHGHHGGNLDDIPLPHVYRFPAPPGAKDYDGEPLRRRVRVQVVNYYRHWHMRISEEDNPLWDPRPNVGFNRPDEPIGWTTTWDHAVESDGREFTNFEYLDRGLAMKWIESIIRRYFPKKTHRVVDDMNGLRDGYEETDAVATARRAIKREGD